MGKNPCFGGRALVRSLVSPGGPSRLRDRVTGLYKSGGLVASIAVVVTETRQQRRQAARMARKSSLSVVSVAVPVSDGVTGGAGGLPGASGKPALQGGRHGRR